MIDEMTLFQVEELAEYWRRHPPVHILVAGFVGYKAEERDTAPPPFDYHPVSMSIPPQLLGIPGVEPGVLPPGMQNAILDADELMRQ